MPRLFHLCLPRSQQEQSTRISSILLKSIQIFQMSRAKSRALLISANSFIVFSMTTLRDFLTNRRSEIQTQLKALRGELREIEAASAALQDPQAEGSRPDAAITRRGRPTLKEMAITILTDHPDGLEANDVRDRIAERFDVQVKRESMSPQLSRLAKEGIIRRGGHNKWLLKTQITASSGQSGEGGHLETSERDFDDLLG